MTINDIQLFGEIGQAWEWYKKCLGFARSHPQVETYQYLSAKAYTRYMCLQALYWATVRPT